MGSGSSNNLRSSNLSRASNHKQDNRQEKGKEMKYADGTPMPKEHQEWFNSGPIKPETLEMWLNIIKESQEKEREGKR